MVQPAMKEKKQEKIHRATCGPPQRVNHITLYSFPMHTWSRLSKLGGFCPNSRTRCPRGHIMTNMMSFLLCLCNRRQIRATMRHLSNKTPPNTIIVHVWVAFIESNCLMAVAVSLSWSVFFLFSLPFLS